MTDKIMAITNKTMVPIGFIIFIWFIVSWTMDVKSKTETNALELNKNEMAHIRMITKIDEAISRLSRIEGILQEMRRKGLINEK